ncbi:ComF family protein [Kroppenstedtia sanguinis]|uniref:ComF family protein n=1 Tax=Kroppenstedtia sanguinis TaxID=1380684 RepID=A0ABW4CBD2_9BACL
MSRWWEKWFAAPGLCPLCGSVHSASVWAGVWDRLCSSCQAGLHLIQPPCCPLCGRSWPVASLCGDCLRHRSRDLERNVGVIRYTSFAKEWIRLFKYRGQEGLAEPLGEMMAEALFASGMRPEAVTYVPLHPDRMRQRGFNQSELLAREVAHRLHLPLRSVLERTRPTPPQSRRNRWERMNALVGAFRLQPFCAETMDKKWLIVDDVYTTGSTLTECAKTLKTAGAKQVCSLTWAR